MNLIPSALMITLIGMGLVFVALLLLWGLMELMMRLTAKQAAKEAAEAEAGEGEEEAEEVQAAPAAVPARRQAAAAAVAVALALKTRSGARGGMLPQSMVEAPSAWQAVQRSALLNKRSGMYSRKQRGSVR